MYNARAKNKQRHDNNNKQQVRESKAMAKIIDLTNDYDNPLMNQVRDLLKQTVGNSLSLLFESYNIIIIYYHSA